jgi:hypothetical protein
MAGCCVVSAYVCFTATVHSAPLMNHVPKFRSNNCVGERTVELGRGRDIVVDSAESTVNYCVSLQ